MKFLRLKSLLLMFFLMGSIPGSLSADNNLLSIKETEQNGKSRQRMRHIPIVVSCVGNSITYGKGVDSIETESYPALLQEMLGKGYQVHNYGVSGKTAMTTEQAYINTKRYQEALDSNPDIVIIKLGTNDSRMPFREHIPDSFVVQYTRLIDSFQSLPSHPRVILVLPVASYLTDETKQTDEAIAALVIPRIKEIAESKNLELVDLHTPTLDKEDLFPDKLHPNKQGMMIIAEKLKEAILK